MARLNGDKMQRSAKMDENQTAEDARTSRRRLLQGAAAAGVGVAVLGAPKVSVVPAYGLTVSGLTDSKCYGFAFSSNDPTGKGWMKLDDQQGAFGAPVFGPTTGPADHAGNGSATYTWALPSLGSFPAGDVSITVTGCVNAGAGAITSVIVPGGTAFCVKFTNAGAAIKKDLNKSNKTPTCSDRPAGDLAGGGVISSASLTTGDTATISTTGPGTCVKNDLGKINWVFNVEKC